MNKFRELSIIILLILLLTPSLSTLAWWDVAHQRLASKAIEYLPDGWREFFGHYRYFIEETSVWPDTVLRKNPDELNYHFYDSEFPRDTHLTNPDRGLLPWRVAQLTENLTNYIKERNWYKVVETAGILSHYMADVTNPYHTTADYNPPVTSNVTAPGVAPKHGFIEGLHAQHLDELIPPDLVITPTYIDDPLEFMFSVISESYSHLDELNSIVLGEDITDPSDDRGWPDLKPLFTNRTITAIWLIASIWYTAIVDADALDKAPNPEEFTELALKVKGVEVPEDLSGFSVRISVRDLIGVPVEPDIIKVTLAGEKLEITNLDIGQYMVTISKTTLEEYSGQTVTFSIHVEKDGYKSDDYSKDLSIPLLEEEQPTGMRFEYIIALAIIIIVVLGVMMYLRRRGI